MVAKGKGIGDSVGSGEDCGVCAICLDKIALQEMALVKGCEHAYWFVCNFVALIDVVGFSL